MLGALVGYLGLIDLGARGAITKFVATSHAAGRHDEAGRVTSAGLILFSAVGIAAALIGSVVALHLERFYEIPSESLATARLAVFLAGLTVAISIFGSVFGGVIAALLRFDYFNAVEAAVTVVRTAAIVLALERGYGLVALIEIQLITGVARTAIYALGMRRIYPELRFRFTGTWELVPKLISFGVMSLLIQASGALISYSDSLLIGAFLSLQAVTFFVIGSNLVQYARSVVAGVSQALAPMAGALEGRGEVERVGDTLLVGGRVAALAILPIAVAFLLRGETFIALWMGEQFAEPVGAVLRILAPTLWLFAGLQVCTGVMMGIDRHRGMVPAYAIEAVVNLLLCIVLVRPLGIMGVALAILLPRLVISLGFGPWYARLVLGTPMSAYWWQALFRPALAMLPFAAACAGVELWWRPAGLLLFFVQIGAALPLAVLGAWIVALDAPERVLLLRALERRRRSSRPLAGPS
ncbi:MAG: oligosaccharide flippase family protein [Candidatus Binatia bacterium]